MSDLLTFSPPGALDTGTKSFAGAKATFFNAGTTTPRTVYTDQAETIPAASPLVADAAGLWPEIFASGGAVKVVVTYSDDTTGYTLDPCTKVAAAGAGAASVSFTPSILRPYDNVQEAIDSGTFPGRTITAGAGISVTNGNGVSGNPTVAVSGITTAQIAAATLVTASETIASNNNDTTLPTSAAVKGYADSVAIGVGQVWTDVSGSRVIATNYTNTTGRPIQVSVRMTLTATTGSGSATLTIAGTTVATVTVGESNGASWNAMPQTLSAIIPAGAVYAVTGTNASIQGWSELR